MGALPTYCIVGEEGRRWEEEREVDAVQPVLPSQPTINDDTVVPGYFQVRSPEEAVGLD